MKKIELTAGLMATFLTAGAALAAGNEPAAAAEPASSAASAAAADAAAIPAQAGWETMCLFGAEPPAGSKYRIVRALKEAKQTYGSARELVPRLVEDARRGGGQAIIRYSGAQRFGFWPWRLARPVVSGQAIQWDEAPTKSCEDMGGVTAGQLVNSNVSPARNN